MSLRSLQPIDLPTTRGEKIEKTRVVWVDLEGRSRSAVVDGALNREEAQLFIDSGV